MPGYNSINHSITGAYCCIGKIKPQDIKSLKALSWGLMTITSYLLKILKTVLLANNSP